MSALILPCGAGAVFIARRGVGARRVPFSIDIVVIAVRFIVEKVVASYIYFRQFSYLSWEVC
jgi:hypothetical protein